MNEELADGLQVAGLAGPHPGYGTFHHLYRIDGELVAGEHLRTFPPTERCLHAHGMCLCPRLCLCVGQSPCWTSSLRVLRPCFSSTTQTCGICSWASCRRCWRSA